MTENDVKAAIIEGGERIMNQQQFIRWLKKQNLTSIQVRMAAILFAINGYESASEFVRHCRK